MSRYGLGVRTNNLYKLTFMRRMEQGRSTDEMTAFLHRTGASVFLRSTSHGLRPAAPDGPA